MELQLKVIDDNNGYNSPFEMDIIIDNDKTILDLKHEINRLDNNIIDKSYIEYNLKINDLIITSNTLILYDTNIVSGCEIFIVF